MYSRQAFVRNRATDLAMELQASLADEGKLDARCDRQVTAISRFASAVREWVAARVPSTSRVFVLVGGILDALGAYRAVDALRDRENRRQLQLAKDLAGLLDGVSADTFTSHIRPNHQAAGAVVVGSMPSTAAPVPTAVTA